MNRSILDGFFTTADFIGEDDYRPFDHFESEMISDRANAILRTWLLEQSKLYGWESGQPFACASWASYPRSEGVHEGYLVEIRERKET